MIVKDELHITIPGSELWDPIKEEFLYTKERKLRLKHSLLSISYWEMAWRLPFLHTELDDLKLRYYVKCMTLDQNVPDDVYYALSADNYKEIRDYINLNMTAMTKKASNKKGSNREFITSETIYYWMTAFNIPDRYEKWHFSRLLALIEMCSEKSQPGKKMSRCDQMNRWAAINNRNRQKFHTKG